MAFSAGAIKFNNKKLIVLKKRLKYYFMKNFDNGTLDVESLVDNICSGFKLEDITFSF